MDVSFTTRNASLDLCLIYKKIPQEGTYTSKVIMKTNAAKLELHTRNSRYKNSQRSVSSESGHSNCVPLPLGATNLESGYPTTKQSIRHQAKTELVRDVQVHLHTIHVEPPS